MYVHILLYEHFINAYVWIHVYVWYYDTCVHPYTIRHKFSASFFLVLKSNIIAMFIPSIHNRAQLSLVEIQLTLDIVEMFLSLEVITQSWEVMPRNPGLMEDVAQENEMGDISILYLAHHHSVCKVIWQIQPLSYGRWMGHDVEKWIEVHRKRSG